MHLIYKSGHKWGIILLCLLSTSAYSQRVFFGLGNHYEIYHYGSMGANYVLPSTISYEAFIPDKKQSTFTFGFPSISLVAAVEYKRWRFIFEPSFNTLNFPYTMTYPYGGGAGKTDKETYYTEVNTLSAPILVNYNFYSSQVNQSRWFFIAGGEYHYTLNKQYVYNIYYQKNMVFGVVGTGVQFRGLYRPFVSIRHHTLVNVTNPAKSRINYISLNWTLHIPSEKIRRQNLYIEQ